MAPKRSTVQANRGRRHRLPRAIQEGQRIRHDGQMVTVTGKMSLRDGAMWRIELDNGVAILISEHEHLEIVL